jgi:pimeloyl-ACP methyl ester carboxylesterase
MQQAWEQGQRSPLWLVGHSMGGLVIRSAMAQAQFVDADWLNRVQAAVYLGSPHHGSPLEVWGNHANRLLGLTAYTAPFMRLGGVRSAGIQDLRHGNLMPEDWQSRSSEDDTRDLRQPCPLLPDITHLLIAARRQPGMQGLAGDDYLVPVRSALGEHEQHKIHAPRLQRYVVEERHHMDLLGDPQVYQALSRLAAG